MDSEMNTPTTTSLVVDNEPPGSIRPKPTPPWRTPFLELLRLLGVTDGSMFAPRVDGQRFCFQPSNDLSEISRIFISLSLPSSIKYDIDIKTIRLTDSDAVLPAVNKLREYANHVLGRVQLFRDRLLQRRIINDTASFLHVDLFTCPLCLYPLISCVECDTRVACSKPLCHGSLIMDCEICYEHGRMICHTCLARNDTVAPLICCSMCGGWCCREDVEWCAGLVTHPAAGTEELAELSRKCEWDCETIIRSHPPKPSPCKFCTFYALAEGWVQCRNNVDDMEPDRCPSQTPFMTDLHLRAAHCPECVDQSPGCECECGLVWICDTCSAIGNKSAINPFLVTCPRCEVNYCVGAHTSCRGYIESCKACKGVTLCKDCQEEEEPPGDTQSETERPKPVTLTTQCTFCETWYCDDCYRTSVPTAMCFSCFDWFCCHCVDDVIEQCPFCSWCVCNRCRTSHPGCPAAVVPVMQHFYRTY